MIARPNLVDYYLARGEASGALSVSRIISRHLLWSETQAHQGEITDLAWYPEAHLLASGGLDGMIHVWQADRGELLSSFAHGAAVQRLRWSAGGTLASSSGDLIRMWPTANALAGAAGCVHAWSPPDPSALGHQRAVGERLRGARS